MMSLRTIKILKTLPPFVNSFLCSDVYFEDFSFHICFSLVCHVSKRDVSAYIILYGQCPTTCNHLVLPKVSKIPIIKAIQVEGIVSRKPPFETHIHF